ncbi:MAG: DUF177 domain-containing protein [Candidatus Binatia bacterium]
MKIAIKQITESPKELSFSEKIDELNQIYAEGKGRDFRFPPSLDVSLVYYRSGQEIFFQGWFGGTIEGTCSRCLKTYSFPMTKNFDFILTPEPLPAKSRGLNQDEMGLSFYSAEEINLSPFIQEQLLLALPMRPLCDERCLGLCAGCGVNLNNESCLCDSQSRDPRTAFFRNLRLSR